LNKCVFRCAGINNGDYVVINKQPVAHSGEIVAVDINGSATLKTFRPMGGNILLIAENKNYEPIIIEDGDVRVIGVAVGVIKK
jgi:DNA helicase II / ATP-dependent DNA helicase PcrA